MHCPPQRLGPMHIFVPCDRWGRLTGDGTTEDAPFDNGHLTRGHRQVAGSLARVAESLRMNRGVHRCFRRMGWARSAASATPTAVTR